uniref:Deoxyuridine 5'-triphosphate nucleotidohydrolase n=1 Tax=Tetranychus urticae TaxID=32264 RepID=T1KEL4_TETUR
MEPSKYKLRFKKLDPSAIAPIRMSSLSAGIDLHSKEDTTVPASGRQLIGTGLQLQIPLNCYGRIAPRSGMAWNYFLDVGAGVIDSDYTGEVKVLLFNFGKEDYKVKQGDRIAQLICEKIIYPEIEEMKELKENPKADGRADNGFGSTGR